MANTLYKSTISVTGKGGGEGAVLRQFPPDWRRRGPCCSPLRLQISGLSVSDCGWATGPVRPNPNQPPSNGPVKVADVISQLNGISLWVGRGCLWHHVWDKLSRFIETILFDFFFFKGDCSQKVTSLQVCRLSIGNRVIAK